MPNSNSDRWLLPDGVDELLPDAALRVDQLRRRITDLCLSWGFELVMPPLIEYLDSLLTGTGETMDLQTFKLVDQQNGRALGVRADLTSQVARMDAHALCRNTPNRLFYSGLVLKARTDGFGSNRTPHQFGAELFGHAGPESDIEIVQLMLQTLSEAGLQAENLILDLGHVGVYRSLVDELNLSAEQEQVLFNGMQRGSIPDVQALLQSLDNQSDTRQQALAEILQKLMMLNGGTVVLEQAKACFTETGINMPAVNQALDNIQQLVDVIQRTHPNMAIHIDLAELRGFRYHTGLLFAAYTSQGMELTRGGRYDAIGAAFGNPRPATGFTGDLKKLATLMPSENLQTKGIFVAHQWVSSAWEEMSRLRQQGERVIAQLPDDGLTPQIAQCDRQLVQQDGQWQLLSV